ncbi:hypothetical protein BCR34DRAFT_388906 [Clohesyomyces aquaticus]|uniref:Uncharacterized protein n=1 Tax=Clohesyomyces aquaticus TaxID=1231657 RepID=A0A1Y1ZEY4_9PLEO|nr:hypothetical protein BCR34DRAFT_388906 [Clohesyomyces aquaticus]
MDIASASKLGYQPDFNNTYLLTPGPFYSPQSMEGSYSAFGSPEFPHHMGKNGFMPSGLWTPQTPESFSYGEPMPMADGFDQYIDPHAWSENGSAPAIGLGLHEDPAILSNEPVMQIWQHGVDEHTSTPVGQMRAFESPFCESPASTNAWPVPSSLSEHTRAVPSLSISEYSVPDSDSPTNTHNEWTFQCDPNEMEMEKPAVATTNFNGVGTTLNETQSWGAPMLSRSPTY